MLKRWKAQETADCWQVCTAQKLEQSGREAELLVVAMVQTREYAEGFAHKNRSI